MDLILLPGEYAMCRLDPATALPAWAVAGGFFSLTRTSDELSVICEDSAVPDDVRCERGWSLLQFAGTFEFTAVGVLASVAEPLRQAGVSLLAVSTFDTDYVLIKMDKIRLAIAALTAAGHRVTEKPPRRS